MRGLDDRWPALIKGRFGVSHTDAYDKIQVPSLSDMPYQGRGFTIDASYEGISDVDALARQSRAIARGTVVAISRPRFNSDDGSFWDPALVDEPGVVPSASFVMRDVTMHVSTVYGSKVSDVDADKDLTFIAPGGQVEVDLDAATAGELGFPGKGTYVIGSPAEVALAVGDELVVFLNSTPIHGLYGGRYGYQFGLYPTHPQHFAFRVGGNSLSDLAESRPLTLDSKTLPDLAETLGTEAGPAPRPGTFRKEPHSPS
ncbi:MAG: hypothetical protein GEU86_09980 [Actinophytocola sp.]|nr:hypothetical protein [Actinophytocola sp.]